MWFHVIFLLEVSAWDLLSLNLWVDFFFFFFYQFWKFPLHYLCTNCFCIILSPSCTWDLNCMHGRPHNQVRHHLCLFIFNLFFFVIHFGEFLFNCMHLLPLSYLYPPKGSSVHMLCFSVLECSFILFYRETPNLSQNSPFLFCLSFPLFFRII